MELTLTFRKTPLSLQLLIYGDADFAGKPEENDLTMWSTSAFVAFIRGIGALTAFCGLKKTLSHSTAESKYTVISRIGKVSFVITLFDDIAHTFPGSTVIYVRVATPSILYAGPHAAECSPDTGGPA